MAVCRVVTPELPPTTTHWSIEHASAKLYPRPNQLHPVSNVIPESVDESVERISFDARLGNFLLEGPLR